MGKHKKRRDRFTPAPVAAPVASAAASPGGQGVSAPATARHRVFWQNLTAAIALGFLALLAYSNSFTGGWAQDNATIIGDDPRIRSISVENIKAVFQHNYWWPTLESDLYRPLTTLSFMFNYTVLDNGAKVEQIRQQDEAQGKAFDYGTLDNGSHLIGYHVVNFLLHWMNIVLVLVIVRRLSGNLTIAMLAASIFAVHPLNVEVVTNIVGRADLLATLSILLGGWCYIRAANSHGGARLAWLAGACFNALWGGFAKESAVIICPFVMLYDLIWRWPGLPGPTFGKRCGQAIWEFFLKGWTAVLLPALVMIGVFIWNKIHSPVFAQVFVDNPIARADTWFQGRMTAIKVLGRYLALLVFPGTLSSDYSYNQIPLYGMGSVWQDAQCWLALAAVAGLLGLAYWLRRSQPLLAWGIALMFAAQILTANLILPIGTIMAERFEYLPSVGYAVVTAQLLWWMGAAFSRWQPNHRHTQTITAGALTALLVLGLGVRTYFRNLDWKTESTLWKSALAASPNSFKVYKAYANTIWNAVSNEHTGDADLEEKTLAQSIKLAEKGLSILDNPPLPISKQDNTLYQDLGQDYCLMGEYLDKQGKHQEALTYYHKSLDVLFRARDVDHWVNQTSQAAQLARGRPASDIHDVGNFRIYVLLSLTYYQLGDWKNLESSGNYVIRLAPLIPDGYRLVAWAYDHEGRTPDAIVEIMQGLLIDMYNGGCWYDLASYYKKLGVTPIPIFPVPGKNTYGLNYDNPLVQDELNHAGVDLIQNIQKSKFYEEAETYQNTLINQMHVPAQMFETK